MGLPEEHRTGDAEIDAMREIAHDLHQQFTEQAVISQAEGAVASARLAELQERSKKAYRRIAAMRGQLTRARKNGSAERVAAAAVKLEQAETEFGQVSHACIEEGHQILAAGLERSGAMLDTMGKAWDADRAVTDALARPRPPM
ncbi:hypothetical protein [Streptosporangium sp. CA-115845]|uniref:hypothetical protein n=1 Tax=Streptosporangium sp. CA-115845 TaxID=3240071 RepID=UPI003D8B4FE0